MLFILIALPFLIFAVKSATDDTENDGKDKQNWSLIYLRKIL